MGCRSTVSPAHVCLSPYCLRSPSHILLYSSIVSYCALLFLLSHMVPFVQVLIILSLSSLNVSPHILLIITFKPDYIISEHALTSSNLCYIPSKTWIVAQVPNCLSIIQNSIQSSWRMVVIYCQCGFFSYRVILY